MAEEKSAVKNGVYKVMFYAAIALALTYIFWGTDIIPDQLALVLPGTFLGYIDDAVVILSLIFFLAKLKQWSVGKKGQPGGLKGLWGWIISIGIVTLALLYVFFPIDLIPDAWPWMGFMDDAVVAITAIILIRRIKKRI